ncbi:dephospho-CoA kinase [Clostridium sp. Marseille-P3244]|uniref:dephospho-CoA kinase n=1 Tax=Clostridium sp. Marseille-P3244 TaxID=1871020 RepID=UPI000931CFB8|nr:dephospho-CoA kinase [Clostridium sp. Marseille-P3244]
MKVLGITGGVGSGKSQILNYLKEIRGAYICQMDETARKLQKKGTDCFRRIVEQFGTGILAEDGELDRVRLGSIVFSDAGSLETLNRIVHPEVIRHVRQDIARQEKEGTKLYVLEAALLPDAGAELCNEIWYIYTEENIRRRRLKMSRGYTDEKITQMIASQPSDEEFRQASTVVIDNSGSFENTKRQIGERLRS